VCVCELLYFILSDEKMNEISNHYFIRDDDFLI
jgi:hypothetical protein